jgi:hypothetical protein
MTFFFFFQNDKFHRVILGTLQKDIAKSNKKAILPKPQKHLNITIKHSIAGQLLSIDCEQSSNISGPFL